MPLESVIAVIAFPDPVVVIFVLSLPSNAVLIAPIPVLLSFNTSAISFRVSNVEGAPLTKSEIAPVTNAVVAICVVLVPAAAVGAVGVPVNSGELNNA